MSGIKIPKETVKLSAFYRKRKNVVYKYIIKILIKE